ncbi:MAG: DUF1257 domain-containing protein [Myxococcota bacterium]
MSHLSTVKTQVKDLAALTDALAEMGFTLVMGGTVSAAGQTMSVDASMTLPSGRVAGFKRTADGTYEMVTDWYYVQRELGNSAQFTQRLQQMYGVHKATREATVQGYTVQRETDAQGVIRLTLSRAY